MKHKKHLMEVKKCSIKKDIPVSFNIVYFRLWLAKNEINVDML